MASSVLAGEVKQEKSNRSRCPQVRGGGRACGQRRQEAPAPTLEPLDPEPPELLEPELPAPEPLEPEPLEPEPLEDSDLAEPESDLDVEESLFADESDLLSPDDEEDDSVFVPLPPDLASDRLSVR